MPDPPDKPRYIGFYRNHAVKFFHDDTEQKPWRFTFDDGPLFGPEKNPPSTMQGEHARESDIDTAKSIALAVAQRYFGGPREENWDEWLDLSQDAL